MANIFHSSIHRFRVAQLSVMNNSFDKLLFLRPFIIVLADTPDHRAEDLGGT